MITCKNATGCQRAVCECDKNFVENAGPAIAAHNDNNSIFYGNPAFDWDTHCSPPPRLPGKPRTPECCGAPGVRLPFNSTIKVCCADGRIETLGSC